MGYISIGYNVIELTVNKHKMLTSLLQYGDLGLFLLRLSIAVIFIYHALPKFQMRNWMLGVGVLELLGALMLIFGLWLQLGAVLLAIIIL